MTKAAQLASQQNHPHQQRYIPSARPLPQPDSVALNRMPRHARCRRASFSLPSITSPATPASAGEQSTAESQRERRGGVGRKALLSRSASWEVCHSSAVHVYEPVREIEANSPGGEGWRTVRVWSHEDVQPMISPKFPNMQHGVKFVDKDRPAADEAQNPNVPTSQSVDEYKNTPSANPAWESPQVHCTFVLPPGNNSSQHTSLHPHRYSASSTTQHQRSSYKRLPEQLVKYFDPSARRKRRCLVR